MTRANTVRRNIDIDKEDADWYASVYPEGTYNWVINLLFKEFRKAHSITPADYAAIGAKELKKQLEERKEDERT